MPKETGVSIRDKIAETVRYDFPLMSIDCSKGIADKILSLPIMKKCGYCNGNGYVPAGRDEGHCGCPTCKGKGEVPEMVEVECRDDISIEEQIKKCEKYKNEEGCKLGVAINGKRSCIGKIKRPKTLRDLYEEVSK